MAFGNAELRDDETKRRVLEVFTDRLAPGLWSYARLPTDQESRVSCMDERTAPLSCRFPQL
jgi:hypothetical protein